MGNHVRRPIVVNGLVLYLDAANPKSYPGSGTTWKDLSGVGNHGTLTNGPAYNSNNAASSLVFDGVDDWVDCGLASAGNSNSAFTFCAWASVQNAGAWHPILTRGQDASAWGATITLTIGGKAGASVVPTALAGPQIDAIGTTTIQANTWYYIVGVWSPGVSLSLYLNGVLEKTTNTIGTGLRLGITGWALGRFTASIWCKGNIPVAKVYNRALTASEVLQNFNAQRNRFNI